MLLVVKYISQLLSCSKRRRGFTLQRNIILECKQIVFSVMSKYISQLVAAREEAVSPNATHSPPFLLQFFLSSNNVGFRGSKTAGLNKDHFAPFFGGPRILVWPSLICVLTWNFPFFWPPIERCVKWKTHTLQSKLQNLYLLSVSWQKAQWICSKTKYIYSLFTIPLSLTFIFRCKTN